MGTNASALTVAGTSAGTVIDNAGGFLSFGDADNFIRRSGASLEMASESFTLSSSSFKIGSGTLAAASGYIVISGGNNKIYLGDSITLDGANEKIYIGTGTYANTDTDFYVDGTGKFSLGEALAFDGSDLTVSGTVYASAGSFTGNISAGSGNIGN